MTRPDASLGAAASSREPARAATPAGSRLFGQLRYQALRLRHLAAVARALPEAVARLRWPPEKLREERERRLRALLFRAKTGSPWHAKRLAHIDPAGFSEADLGRLPVMTKDDLMSSFDEIVTDPRLSLAAADVHLAGLEDDAYLLDQYHVVSSGGSSGRRGVFVYDWSGWTECFVAMQRYAVARMGCMPAVTRRIIVGQVAANKATHMTSALAQTFANPLLKIRRFPVTLAFERIVEGLNTLQPMVLQGYPSMLRALAHEAAAGRLRIAPQTILSIAEPLFAETRAALVRAFGVPVHNWWGTSEGGGMGMSCGAGPWLHLSDDTLIIEPVDEDGRPVPAGVRSAKIYVTNLFNPVMPIIRYEISDAVTLMDGRCPCGSHHRRVEDVEGRLEDAFLYRGGVIAHPVVFRTYLANHPDVIDYQVRQTVSGADIAVLAARPFDRVPLATAIAASLTKLGLDNPVVTITPCARLERHVSGKLARYVGLRLEAVPPT